ncbi:hypothetical protein [Tuberibacillus calidus]|jgi:hypothetical protein|uniref:hypothetical protein n=1 Tax=Tuberibacillus calidus TaxID=340097 RepID=UPI00040817E7|nr:hypothetical protein [Tuberibacillus calidus]
MSVYDLDLFLDQTYEIKLGGDIYKLPKQPLTGLHKKITALQMKLRDEMKKPEEEMDGNKIQELAIECVVLILSQDKTKKVNAKFIEENLNTMQMQKIIEIFFKEFQEIEEKN